MAAQPPLGQISQPSPGQLPLVTQPVDEARRVVLGGDVHPLVRRAAGRGLAGSSLAGRDVMDLGLVDRAMPVRRMFLLLKRSPEQEAALRVAIEALEDSRSPSFHRWLTPAQFGARWGAAEADVAAVTGWLQSHGFAVEGAQAGRTRIEFSGTAGQVEEAFHAAIHAYAVNGEKHYANAGDPEIPAALATVVAGISTLNDFHPRAQARRGPRGIYDAARKRIRPELSASGSFGNYLYMGPADAATLYNSPIPALNPAAVGANIDGAGAVIGIIGDSNISTLLNAKYRKLFGLAARPVTVILDGEADPGENSDAVEAYLDTEVANGIAPGANLYFYTAADTDVNYGVDLAAARAVNDNLVDVLNLSFGECEAELGTAGNAFYAGLWEQAAAQGISVTVSSGDSGSADCDDPNTETEASLGLAVNGLASTPYDIAVGGTDLAALAGPDGSGADFTEYVSASNDLTTLRSVMGPIPEVPWDDSMASFPPGTIDTSLPFTVPYANVVAAGGGRSSCVESSAATGGGTAGGTTMEMPGGQTCTGSYPKPPWQAAPGVPADKARDVPDLALFAGNGLNYATWGICTDEDTDATGNPLEDCTPGANGLPANEFYIYGVGGTSASAPLFAGVLALLREKTGERLGLANYVLYQLARDGSAAFRDVTTGNNTVPCSVGSPNCSSNSEGANLQTGYDAGAGYDLATGLGSVDVSALLNDWASVALASSTTQLTLEPTAIEHGQAVRAQVTVTASTGAAAGLVALTAAVNQPSLPAGVAIGNYVLQPGGTTGPISLNALPGGSYRMIAAYGGSAATAQSVSLPVMMTVAPEASTTMVRVAAINPATGQSAGFAMAGLAIAGQSSAGGSVPYGYLTQISATPYGNRSPVDEGEVRPDGVATGSVVFSEGSTSLGREVIGLGGYATARGAMLPPGNYAVTASYTGDSSLNASSGAYTLSVTRGATVGMLSASSTANNGQPIVFTFTLSTESAGQAPSGVVEIRSGATVLAQAPVRGTAGSSALAAAGTATLSVANLPVETAAVEAVYRGDANYAGATTHAISIQGKTGFTIADVSMQLVGEHTTGSAYVPVTSVNGYAGTVKLSCALLTGTTTSTPPSCAMDPASVTLAAGGVGRPLILIFGEGGGGAAGATLRGGSTSSQTGLMRIGGGTGVAALLLLLGLPARRRLLRRWLCFLLLVASLACVTACSTGAKKITAGNYTFSVTGVDAQDATLQGTATVTARVL